MVLKSINRIKENLPNVVHIVMFYSDGSVFQTTFKQTVNVPKVGENLSEIINHFSLLQESCGLEQKQYKKLIFETKDITIIMIKLGEDSNIAIFLETQDNEEIDFNPIQKYLSNLQTLIDMDMIELEKAQLTNFENELDQARQVLKERQAVLDHLRKDSTTFLTPEEERKFLSDKAFMEADCRKLSDEITDKIKKIEEIRTKIKNDQEKLVKR